MEYSKELHEQTKNVLEEKLWFHNTDVIRKLLENYPLFLAEIDRLTKLHEWIPVTPETMPENNKWVIGFQENSAPNGYPTCLINGKWFIRREVELYKNTEWEINTPTHYFILPPQEQP